MQQTPKLQKLQTELKYKQETTQKQQVSDFKIKDTVIAGKDGSQRFFHLSYSVLMEYVLRKYRYAKSNVMIMMFTERQQKHAEVFRSRENLHH